MILEPSNVRLTARPNEMTRPSRKPGYVIPRFLWMALGPAMMMALSVLKLESREDQPGPVDVAFVVVSVGILLIRWGTWLAGDKCDSFGGKADLRSLLGFTGIVAMLACGIWTLATLVATQ